MQFKLLTIAALVAGVSAADNKNITVVHWVVELPGLLIVFSIFLFFFSSFFPFCSLPLPLPQSDPPASG